MRTGLNKFDEGEEIVYTVSEAQVENYKAPVIEKISDNEWAYRVTNGRDYEKTEIEVTKAWNDSDDQDGKLPEEIKVTLTGTIPGAAEGETEKVYENTQTIKADDKGNWSYKWTDLAVYVKALACRMAANSSTFFLERQ